MVYKKYTLYTITEGPPSDQQDLAKNLFYT